MLMLVPIRDAVRGEVVFLVDGRVAEISVPTCETGSDPYCKVYTLVGFREVAFCATSFDQAPFNHFNIAQYTMVVAHR